MHKVPLPQFLSHNPFPHPLTQGFFYREKMRAIHRIAPDRSLPAILEVGGGCSGLTALLYPTANITNLDLNPEYEHAPCNQQPRVHFVCGDATALPFESNTFDAITMFDVLEHIPDHQAAIQEAQRVLKPGGFLLVSTPNENWRFPYYRLMKPICPEESEVMADWGHVRRGYTIEQLQSLIALPCQSTATFINPITIVGHDIAFSRLSRYVRQSLCTLLSPIVWMGHWLHRPESKGTETASVWQKVEGTAAYD
jgi:SAM-dependent methyltransferase